MPPGVRPSAARPSHWKRQKVIILRDRETNRSRGFGFVTFREQQGADAAREALNGKELDGRRMRVDYSLTKTAHKPTPGEDG